MTGTAAPTSFLIRRVVSIPSIPGIFQSIIMSSYGSFVSFASAAYLTPVSPSVTKHALSPISLSSSTALRQVCLSSSTIRLFIPSQAFGTCSSGASCSLSGMVTVNTVPLPGLLSTCISPFIRSMMFLVMAIPRPVPATFMPAWSWARSKGWKICSRNDGSIPTPVSVQRNTKFP